MRFSSGLVLATLAVTAAHAGDPNNLRSTDSKDLTDDELDYLLDPNTDLDDISLVAGKKSNDQYSSRMKSMQSLPDNNSGPLVWDEIQDVIEKDKGSTYVDKKQSGDVENSDAWVLDTDPGTENGYKTVNARKSTFSDISNTEDSKLTNSVSPTTNPMGDLMVADDDAQNAQNARLTLQDPAVKEYLDNLWIEAGEYSKKHDDNNMDFEGLTDDEGNNPLQMEDGPLESTSADSAISFSEIVNLIEAFGSRLYDDSDDGLSMMEDDNSPATKSTKMNNMDATFDDEGNNPFQMDMTDNEPEVNNMDATIDDEGNNPFQMDMTDNEPEVNNPIMVKDVATKGRAPVISKSSMEDESPLQFESTPEYDDI